MKLFKHTLFFFLLAVHIGFGQSMQVGFSERTVNQSGLIVVPESLEVVLYTGTSLEREVRLFNKSSETVQCTLKFDDPNTFAMGQLQSFDSEMLPGGLDLAGNAVLQFPPGQIVLTPASGGMRGGLFLTEPLTATDVK